MERRPRFVVQWMKRWAGKQGITTGNIKIQKCENSKWPPFLTRGIIYFRLGMVGSLDAIMAMLKVPLD